MILIVRNDNTRFIMPLTWDDGTPAAIDLASTVQFSIRKKNTLIAGPFPCLSGTAGANWPAGIVVGFIPPASSAAFNDDVYDAEIEVEVKLAGNPETWIDGNVRIRPDTILNP
jgi:hypothetical protein